MPAWSTTPTSRANGARRSSGSFNDEGRFLGGLYVNRQGAGEVCGGDFPVDLAP